jgi:Flp pilus assembly pilin Flp
MLALIAVSLLLVLKLLSENINTKFVEAGEAIEAAPP